MVINFKCNFLRFLKHWIGRIVVCAPSRTYSKVFINLKQEFNFTELTVKMDLFFKKLYKRSSIKYIIISNSQLLFCISLGHVSSSFYQYSVTNAVQIFYKAFIATALFTQFIFAF